MCDGPANDARHGVFLVHDADVKRMLNGSQSNGALFSD